MSADVIFVAITWLGLAQAFMNEIPMSERHCNRLVVQTTEQYTAFRDLNPEFGFILECRDPEVYDEREEG